jgi:predicted lactoylglutathione lyase
MATKIFVNLPVKNLQRSIAFFSNMGFDFDPQFTDDKATCMMVTDDIFVMLLEEPLFQSFTRKSICDASKSTEVIVTLSAESRSHVDDLINRAVAAGATTPNDAQDQGWMYGRGFADLDGHQWELMYMDAVSFGEVSHN